MLRYVGDSKSLKSRVRQHCVGNVESSALRKTIAVEMGFDIISKKRESGSKKLSISQHHGEELVSEYLQSGIWRIVICQSAGEARDFQWYAIDKKRPPLNKYMQFWNINNEHQYQIYLDQLVQADELNFEGTLTISKSSGVYSLWHKMNPLDFMEIRR